MPGSEERKGCWSDIKMAASVIIVVAGCVGVIWGACKFIDYRVESIVSTDEFKNEVAQRVRPYMVLGPQGEVLLDRGAMTFLQGPPEVKSIDEGKDTVLGLGNLMVTVKPKEYLAIAPLLEFVSSHNGTAQAERGKGLEWVIRIDIGSCATGDPLRMRLEMLR